MKKFLMAAAGAASLAFAALPANATILIALQSNGGAIVDQGVAGPDSLTLFSTAFAGWTVGVQAQGSTDPLLSSNTIDVSSSGSGVLDVYVTRTGIAGPMPGLFQSFFTSNDLPVGWQVVERTYVSAANGFLGTALSTMTFNDIGSNSALAAGPGGAGPYAITERYTVTASSINSANSTIVVRSAVPEPATWAFMILGFGGAGAMIRSRRRALALAA